MMMDIAEDIHFGLKLMLQLLSNHLLLHICFTAPTLNQDPPLRPCEVTR
jgi:hypothetical protein